MKTTRKTNDWVLAARADGATVLATDTAIVVVKAATPETDRIDVAAAATLGACTPRRVRDAVRTGDLKACELSERALSFARADVIAWIESHPARVRIRDLDAEDDADLARRLADG